MTENNINGVILVGGRSSRMKESKAKISYHGKPQHEYLFDLLTPLCKKVFTSCKEHVDIPEKFNPVTDSFNFDSPLNGILCAFQNDITSALLSVPVDMPLIDVDLIQFLIHQRDKSKVATCFWDSTGEFPEPLVTLWESNSYSPLMEYQKKGGISPREFLQQQDVNIIQSPNPKYLININSPEELKDFLKSYMGN